MHKPPCFKPSLPLHFVLQPSYSPAGVEALVTRADAPEEPPHQKVHGVLPVEQGLPLTPLGSSVSRGGPPVAAAVVEVVEEFEAVGFHADL